LRIREKKKEQTSETNGTWSHGIYILWLLNTLRNKFLRSYEFLRSYKYLRSSQGGIKRESESKQAMEWQCQCKVQEMWLLLQETIQELEAEKARHRRYQETINKTAVIVNKRTLELKEENETLKQELEAKQHKVSNKVVIIDSLHEEI